MTAEGAGRAPLFAAANPVFVLQAASHLQAKAKAVARRLAEAQAAGCPQVVCQRSWTCGQDNKGRGKPKSNFFKTHAAEVTTKYTKRTRSLLYDMLARVFRGLVEEGLSFEIHHLVCFVFFVVKRFDRVHS